MQVFNRDLRQFNCSGQSTYHKAQTFIYPDLEDNGFDWGRDILCECVANVTGQVTRLAADMFCFAQEIKERRVRLNHFYGVF